MADRGASDVEAQKQHIRCTFRMEAKPEDVESIRRVVKSSGYFRPNEVDVAIELIEEYLSRGGRCGYRFVFADDSKGNLLGYACYGQIACTDSSYDLYWIAVDESCRGHGIGKRLIKKTEQLVCLLGGAKIYIETSGRPKYASTRSFYARCSYEIVAIIKDFYSVGDDKYIYCKDIKL